MTIKVKCTNRRVKCDSKLLKIISRGLVSLLVKCPQCSHEQILSKKDYKHLQNLW